MKKENFDIKKRKRENIFQVPDKYFDDLTLKIQTRVNQEKESTPIWYRIPKVYWSLSASTFVLIAGMIWIFQINTDHTVTDPMAHFTSEEIIDYLTYEDVSLYDIVDNTDVQDLITEMEGNYLNVTKDIPSDELEYLYDEYDLSTELL